MTAFVYEAERYVGEQIQIFGVSVQPAEEGRKLRERVTRDCQEDRPHIALDPYPLRRLVDPDAQLIRAVGAENEGHWAGLIAAPVTYVVDRAGIVLIDLEIGVHRKKGPDPLAEQGMVGSAEQRAAGGRRHGTSPRGRVRVHHRMAIFGARTGAWPGHR